MGRVADTFSSTNRRLCLMICSSACRKQTVKKRPSISLFNDGDRRPTVHFPRLADLAERQSSASRGAEPSTRAFGDRASAVGTPKLRTSISQRRICAFDGELDFILYYDVKHGILSDEATSAFFLSVQRPWAVADLARRPRLPKVTG